MELKAFFDEMEFLLMKNCIVHFFPEGELRPYDTGLQNFKKGILSCGTGSSANCPYVNHL